MRGAITLGAVPVALALGGIASAIAADERPSVRAQDLLDRGFAVAAQGELVESVTCARFTMHVVGGGWREPDSCLGNVKYGSFKRLTRDGAEFVCVSFRDWACYESK